jgi:hypothetical protein
MIAIATAGSFIGPSTTPFCGDQFEPHQQRMLSLFFAVRCPTIGIEYLKNSFNLRFISSCYILDLSSPPL